MKTALITGANSGLGLETAKALAQRGYTILMLCRNEDKGRAAQAIIERANPAVSVRLYLADLSNANTIRRVASLIKTDYPRLDVLVNNAGYTPTRIEFTPEGIEKSFYANHIGPFVLTYHLMEALEAAAAETGDVRVVNLSSGAYALGRVRRFFERDERLSGLAAYCDGKLANILFTRELARRTAGRGITTYAVHPGVVRTNFAGDSTGVTRLFVKLAQPFMRAPAKGAETSVFLASAPLKLIGEGNNGRFFTDLKPKATTNPDITDENARWLWEKSLAYV